MTDLRRRGRACDTDYAGRSLKGQLTQAQRLGARAIVVADSEGLAVRRRGAQDVRVTTADELEALL
jgi:histidyl-tRNA synthetase